jgi:virginiamycin B lyase
LVLALLGQMAPAAQAQVVTEFSSGIADALINQIATGPDGNLWFAEEAGNRVGRITTDGVVTGFSGGVSTGARPRGITVGADGNLWFTEANGGRIGPVDSPGGCGMVRGVQDWPPDPTLPCY